MLRVSLMAVTQSRATGVSFRAPKDTQSDKAGFEPTTSCLSFLSKSRDENNTHNNNYYPLHGANGESKQDGTYKALARYGLIIM